MSECNIERTPIQNSIGYCFRAHGHEYIRLTNPSFQQQKIIRNISNCKTAALGGVRVTCTACGHESYHYHSCGDRHCPMCQHIKKQLWIDKMAVVLFPLKHFHVIFTIPHQLNELLFYNQKILYNAFFQSVNSTIQKVCARQIGGKPGLVCTLHTWGSNLSFHPHVHCIVSGGAYSPSVGWQYSAKPNFFVDAAALAITFKNIFIGHIIRLWEDETLYLQKLTNSISEAAQFKTFYRQLMQTKWVVRIETPILGNQQIIEYLARYVHRVAITNSRIVATNESSITLEYNNYLLQKKGMPACIYSKIFAARITDWISTNKILRPLCIWVKDDLPKCMSGARPTTPPT